MIRMWDFQEKYKLKKVDFGEKHFEDHQEVLFYGLKCANDFIRKTYGFIPEWNGTARISELGSDIEGKQIYNGDTYMFDLWAFNNTIRCPVCSGKILLIGDDYYICLETHCDFECSDDDDENFIGKWFPDIEIPFRI